MSNGGPPEIDCGDSQDRGAHPCIYPTGKIACHIVAAGSLITFGGEVAGRAISVSAFLGVATVVAWLVLSWIFSELIELARPTCTRVRQYFRGFVKAQITALSERVKELHEAAPASGKRLKELFTLGGSGRPVNFNRAALRLARRRIEH